MMYAEQKMDRRANDLGAMASHFCCHVYDDDDDSSPPLIFFRKGGN